MSLKKLLIYSTVLIAGVLFLYYQNNSIVVTNMKLKFDKLPLDFDGFRIVQLSDLHNKTFGKKQYKLVAKIKDARPDIIVITGDIIDSRRYDDKPVVELIGEIKKIAPIYYVTGNHEFSSGKFNELEKKLKEEGVTILRNSRCTFQRNESKIEIVGVDDPMGESYAKYKGDRNIISDELQKALEGTKQESFKILLSHRPELISTYAKYNLDLTFTGHAHGGQMRLPFLGGIIAPNQGFLPKYTSGKFEAGNTVMIVNRGLGNSIFPQRIFNRPEIVVANLEKNK